MLVFCDEIDMKFKVFILPEKGENSEIRLSILKFHVVQTYGHHLHEF